jgi:hypothetical protein
LTVLAVEAGHRERKAARNREIPDARPSMLLDVLAGGRARST